MSNKSRGTSEMPAPQNINYNQFYKINQVFINDFRLTFQELPYIEYKKMEQYLVKDTIPAAVLNEFIRAIASYPYKYVANLMKAIENKDLFKKYFEPLPQQQ